MFGVAPDPLIINTTSIAGAKESEPYATTLSATGGTSPYSWSVTDGLLPDGLSLSSAGEISGTPNESGEFTFTAQVEDASGRTKSKQFTLTVEATPVIENLALNKPVTASADDGTNVAANAVDNNTATRWSAKNFPQSIEVDLGDVYSINATEVVCFSDRAYQFTIDVKTTATGSYTRIVNRGSNTSPGTEASPIIDNFTAIDARYVRITVTGAAVYNGNWVALSEFRVFGTVPVPDVGSLISPSLANTASGEGTTTEIKVYPNPSKEKLTISSASTLFKTKKMGESTAQIEVYSFAGEQVYQTTNVTLPHDVDVSSYKPGIYMIKVITPDGYFIEKVVKE